ncbi:MAG: DNA repair protein RadA [Candidatus Thermofonsia Clade 1 bacterium]|jgi:DNA repair protein RadA/Sms|uniref:DNA repair protein RadA n=1 Tax=Candidatus Thermofonsia Clade 1 bacterium TaxID=2364210 RepID=A0A2M8PG88_9CHLR|nr:MAG: DNA repair protein RadA [Candidatus Thermofonsia Clade 1 bacterium]RMF49282.1 MAG: DNA repair protein RadA [Chloroflexota bacterium]
MPKTRITYVCEVCGRRYTQLYGRCPNCKAWDSLHEVIEAPEPKAPAHEATPNAAQALRSEPQRLGEVPSGGEERLPVPVEEFSRVLGGGLVAGSIILVSGDPGIGKSTLLLQLAAVMAQTIGRVLYSSGEESIRQLKMRADRLEIAADELFLVTETNLESVMAHVERLQPRILIVDSIQTMYSDDKPSSAGTVTQVRECTARLQLLAKTTGISVFLVGHVTKEGLIAGPRVLEHIVDTVLYLEGDAFQAYRLLRSVKNRFGATSEVGVFEMRDKGMVEVRNPSEAFLAERVINAPGSAIVVTMEGTRPLLVEVQALASPTVYPNPRRTANGIDFNRLQLLTAVLARRVGLRLAEQDVFVNVIGGLTIDEPAADLAVATAIASSVWDKPLSADLALIGEIGLSGELRAVSQLSARLREAAKLGFKRCIVPKTLRRADALPQGIQAIPARTLAEALAVALPRE